MQVLLSVELEPLPGVLNVLDRGAELLEAWTAIGVQLVRPVGVADELLSVHCKG